MNLGAFIGVYHRFRRAWFGEGAYVYCHGEEIADVADLRLERNLCMMSSTVSVDTSRTRKFVWHVKYSYIGINRVCRTKKAGGKRWETMAGQLAGLFDIRTRRR